MGLEVPVYLDDLVVTNPLASDPRSEGDDHLRGLKTSLKNTFPGMTGRAWRTQAKASGYTALVADNISHIKATAAITIAFTAAATLGNGWMAVVQASSGDVVLDPNASELINGAATYTVLSGHSVLVICDGSAFVAIDLPKISTLTSALTASITPTGVVMDYVGTTAPTSWVLLSGRTIGNAASGATERANADTEALFTLLWNSMANAEAPVSGGRGASAAADFAANKTITLPDARGRAVFGKDNMGGTTASRLTNGNSGIDGTVQGKAGGDERAWQHSHGPGTLATGTSGAHTHTAARGNAVGSGGDYPDGNSFANEEFPQAGPNGTHSHTVTTGTTATDGANTTSQNVPPALVLTKIIKL